MKNYKFLKNSVGILSKVCLDCGYETSGFRELTDMICYKCKSTHQNKTDIFKTRLNVEYKISTIKYRIEILEKSISDYKSIIEEIQDKIDLLNSIQDKFESIKIWLEDIDE